MKFGENVKTAMVGALKRRSGPLHDNLSDLPERKAPQREGHKHRGAHMWKIIVGESRLNCRDRRNLVVVTPEGISSGPETKASWREALSTVV